MYGIDQKLTIHFINHFIIEIIFYLSFIFPKEQLKISLKEYYAKVIFY